ncbi:hypothetical protein QWY93_12835 [Echinicola jeungdonensis]|uniref:Uncharacterized protein n=1 Tax=Echinicola jeungdonensis TaxID=709343 RepID=A0ABV5JAX9_9BACT|nr:hypothetical protein [Echinicola jeungdonensis]MDN3670210.1 hypothetical protein [Echinicola jeungdonensis]
MISLYALVKITNGPFYHSQPHKSNSSDVMGFKFYREYFNYMLDCVAVSIVSSELAVT